MIRLCVKNCCHKCSKFSPTVTKINEIVARASNDLNTGDRIITCRFEFTCLKAAEEIVTKNKNGAGKNE